jgi:hypothetical protein
MAIAPMALENRSRKAAFLFCGKNRLSCFQTVANVRRLWYNYH